MEPWLSHSRFSFLETLFLVQQRVIKKCILLISVVLYFSVREPETREQRFLRSRRVRLMICATRLEFLSRNDCVRVGFQTKPANNTVITDVIILRILSKVVHALNNIDFGTVSISGS